MSFRGLIAAVIGGSFGFAQFFWLVYLDASNPDSHLPTGIVWFWIFSVTWILELVAFVAIGMYRIAPSITRLLRDDLETFWILQGKKRNYSRIVQLASLTIMIRALVRLIDAGSVTQSVVYGLAFAFLPFVVPRSIQKKSE